MCSLIFVFHVDFRHKQVFSGCSIDNIINVPIAATCIFNNSETIEQASLRFCSVIGLSFANRNLTAIFS